MSQCKNIKKYYLFLFFLFIHLFCAMLYNYIIAHSCAVYYFEVTFIFNVSPESTSCEIIL